MFFTEKTSAELLSLLFRPPVQPKVSSIATDATEIFMIEFFILVWIIDLLTLVNNFSKLMF
jgi:hypothetical protein